MRFSPVPRGLVIRLLGLFLFQSGVIGTELFVPADFPTIQAALESVEDGDTITVSLGTYAEELTTPALSFLLRGNVEPDTGLYPRPVVDPSSLDHPEERRCVNIQDGFPVFEDIAFRNGPEMYPRTEIGGVLASGSAEFRRCLFDSTSYGIYDGIRLVLADCRFFDNQRSCITTFSGRIIATDCFFSGQGAEMVRCSNSSSFVRCQFRDNASGHLLNMNGNGQLVQQCVFGPGGPHIFEPVTGHDFGGEFIECLFTDLRPGPNVIGIARDCAEPFVVRNCIFEDIRVTSGQGGAGIGFGCSENAPGTQAIIDSNIFVNCTGFVVRKCISIGPSGGILNRNRFQDVFPASIATVQCQGNCVLRNNLFFNTGYALEAVSADARWNWWGDSTGPYHAELNPNGQGDEITGNVDFIPWYTDTMFTQDAVDARPELPQGYSLMAYPNPFNATTRLKLIAGEATIISLDLFDILGRRVRQLWSGPVLGEHEISFTADDLPSGIYFARAMDVLYNRPLAKTKLVLLR